MPRAPNGMPRSPGRPSRGKLTVLRLLLLCLLTLLTEGCSTLTPATVTPGRDQLSLKARCAGWRPISYSGSGDTLLTIRQIRIHNRFGVLERCWK